MSVSAYGVTLVYQAIAASLSAMRSCLRNHASLVFDITEACGETEPEGGMVAHWQGMAAGHEQYARTMTNEYLPSGAGFDGGTSLLVDKSREDRLVFFVGFHHMVEGFYDGWTDHEVIVKPSLVHGVDIRVTGRDRSGIKEHIAECFEQALMAEIG